VRVSQVRGERVSVLVDDPLVLFNVGMSCAHILGLHLGEFLLLFKTQTLVVINLMRSLTVFLLSVHDVGDFFGFQKVIKWPVPDFMVKRMTYSILLLLLLFQLEIGWIVFLFYLLSVVVPLGLVVWIKGSPFLCVSFHFGKTIHSSREFVKIPK
jgi:hypothetical protein